MNPGDLIYRDGQYEFNGLLLNDNDHGIGEGLMVTRVTGLWESPEYKVLGDSEMNDSHGGHLGEALYSIRTIVLDVSAYAPTEAALHGLLRSVRKAFEPGNEDKAFVYRRSGVGMGLLWARSRGPRGFPSGWDMAHGWSNGVVVLKAENPRHHDYDLRSAQSITASGAAQSQVVVDNDGDIDTYPVLEIAGPAEDPVITNGTTGRALKIVGLNVAAGQTLVIDTWERTVAIGAADHRDKLPNDNQWWTLEPGDNTIVFDRINPPANQATLTVKYRNAWR